MQDFTKNYQELAATAAPADRAAFIRRTYVHVAVSIALFAFIEAAMIRAGLGEKMLLMLSGTRFGWLGVMLAFMAVSWLADRWALAGSSQGVQYAGLGIFIVAEAIIFLPMLTLAAAWQPGLIGQAAVITLALVAALTVVAMMTRKDFSFLRPILTVLGFVALGAIVCSILFDFGLGTLFSAAMILFAGGSVLYSTSNILHKYQVDQHVAASLSLFASIALLFIYILRFLSSFGRD